MLRGASSDTPRGALPDMVAYLNATTMPCEPGPSSGLLQVNQCEPEVSKLHNVKPQITF